jgi:hypothetical protein
VAGSAQEGGPSTFITEMAETSVSDHVLESMTGHLSRRMLEHDSHMRLAAKRRAFAALDEQREQDRQQSHSGETETVQ